MYMQRGLFVSGLFFSILATPGCSPPMPTGSPCSLPASHGICYLLGGCLSEPIARDGLKGELLGNVQHHNLVFPISSLRAVQPQHSGV